MSESGFTPIDEWLGFVQTDRQSTDCGTKSFKLTSWHIIWHLSAFPELVFAAMTWDADVRLHMLCHVLLNLPASHIRRSRIMPPCRFAWMLQLDVRDVCVHGYGYVCTCV